jgi:D-beta-D-heptose 7-phosphate kinase/D-beta-D-heptose 1-phosphate adenosyltransferase
MSAGPLDVIDRFRDVRAFVVGDAILDTWLDGSSSRLSPEAPVPVVDVRCERQAPGGAANVAATLAKLGATVSLVSVVGDDAPASTLQRELQALGICPKLIRERGRTTLVKTRVVADGQPLVRFDSGSTCTPGPGTAARLAREVAALAGDADVLVVSDYGYGTLVPQAIEALASRRGRRVLAIDSKDLSRYRELTPNLVKPNYSQALALLPEEVAVERRRRRAQVAARRRELLDRTGASVVAVTLDSEGAIMFGREMSPYQTFASPATGPVSGAGDAYLAAFAVALASGAEATVGADIAAAAARSSVSGHSSGGISATALRSYFGRNGKVVEDAGELLLSLEPLRRDGRRIVFTNGCFDVLHPGHVSLIEQARALGELLVVGINADESVRRLKGPARPVNPLPDRAGVLASLSAVDFVVPFDDDTPAALIEAIRPDIFVKGGDYSRENLPEATAVERYGGAVHILPYLEGFSTTGLIARVQSCPEGKEPRSVEVRQ